MSIWKAGVLQPAGVGDSVSLTAEVTGTLPVANGGTGLATFTAIGAIPYATAATTLAALAAVATGRVLASGGVATAPAWTPTPWLATSLKIGGNSGVASGALDVLGDMNLTRNDGFGRDITLQCSRTSEATPTIVSGGDQMGAFVWRGYAAGYQLAARLMGEVDSVSSPSVRGRFTFETTGTDGTLVDRARIDCNITAGETAMLLSVAGAAMIRVSVGANDSESAGFRNLRVPNA